MTLQGPKIQFCPGPVGKLGKKSRSCSSAEGARLLGGPGVCCPGKKLKHGNSISCDLSMEFLPFRRSRFTLLNKKTHEWRYILIAMLRIKWQIWLFLPISELISMPRKHTQNKYCQFVNPTWTALMSKLVFRRQ